MGGMSLACWRNIAARVEGLAAGGGIAISGTVYEHIKEKLENITNG